MTIDISNFIEESITEHIFDIRHSNYNELLEILGSDKIDKLSIYLEREDEKSFQEGIDKILEDTTNMKDIFFPSYF